MAGSSGSFLRVVLMDSPKKPVSDLADLDLEGGLVGIRQHGWPHHGTEGCGDAIHSLVRQECQ